MTQLPLISGKGLTKVYGSFVALSEANIVVMPGEVRALIGSNGAGKSTLIKVLTGAIAPTLGSVEIEGVPAPLGNPTEMIARGVACIYQHSNLAPGMTVMDNIYLGRQPSRGFGLLDRKAHRAAAEALLERHGLALDLDAVVGTLPTVKQKEVEIAKALALDAKVLLMDEPTGWLTAADVQRLHQTIASLKQRGVGIVYISHMLDEIFAVCDTMSIMRDGKVIAESRVQDIDKPRVVELMVGEKLAQASLGASMADRKPRGGGMVRLSARGLTKKGVFNNIDFEVHAGEIFCITGLIGSKRTELMHAIFGVDGFDLGDLQLDGTSVKFRGPRHAMAAGIGFVSEDRHRDGLMLGLSVTENLVMATLRRYLRGGLLDCRGIKRRAAQAIGEFNIRPPDGARLVRLLSGGNQQKVLLGKWLGLSPKVLILDEPTVGVDVGAKAEIYGILRAERDKGAAILVVSSDLEEVMTLADRIGIMVAGRLRTIHDADKVDMATIISEIGEAP